MNSKTLVLLGVVILIVVLGGAMFLNKPSQPTTTNTNVNTNAPTTEENQMENKAANEVTVTSNGFEPKDIKIKSGTKVTWINRSGQVANVSSDSHPTHLLWPFLNLGAFEDGQSVSVVFEKSGKYTYHNHLNSSQAGSVTVE